MKLFGIIFFCLIAINAYSQLDSAWINNYSADMIPLTGTKIKLKGLVDEAGNNVDLKKFRGKVVYLGFWDPGCGSALTQNMYEPFLLSNLKTLGIDDQIVLVKVCDHRIGFDAWKNYIDTNDMVGIQLHTGKDIFKMFDRKKLANPPVGTPNYWIIDKTGTISGTSVSMPMEFFSPEYLLLKALRGVKCSDAIKPYLQNMPGAEVIAFNKKLELKFAEGIRLNKEVGRWIDEENERRKQH
jgi:hypothetical protein